MRTKKMSNTRFAFKLDKIFWFFVSFYPLICYAFYILSQRSASAEYVSFFNFIAAQFSFVGNPDNPIHWAFVKMFAPGGVFPIMSYTSGLNMFTWFATVEVIHTMFDVIVFIPRLAHKWISKAVQND